ncbi:hypothetical protein [Granulibacter bethesdensis]|nr:hypothetical protein [Granulibacter bethesdensis]
MSRLKQHSRCRGISTALFVSIPVFLAGSLLSLPCPAQTATSSSVQSSSPQTAAQTTVQQSSPTTETASRPATSAVNRATDDTAARPAEGSAVMTNTNPAAYPAAMNNGGSTATSTPAMLPSSSAASAGSNSSASIGPGKSNATTGCRSQSNGLGPVVIGAGIEDCESAP